MCAVDIQNPLNEAWMEGLTRKPEGLSLSLSLSLSFIYLFFFACQFSPETKNDMGQPKLTIFFSWLSAW